MALDAVALARLRELDPDGRHKVLPRVLGAYVSSLQRMLEQLLADKDSRDAAAISSLAHTLKSSSASVGAMELAHHCAEIERRLRSGDSHMLAQDIETLLTEGERALVAVRAMLNA